MFSVRIFTLLTLLYSFCSNATPIRVVTEHFPPYQVVKNGELKSGLAADFVKALLVKVDIQAEIEVYPWARAYKIAQTHSNVLIFSLARTAQRENEFHWIGSFPHIINSYLWAHKDKHIEINEIEDAKRYIAGVPRDDTTHHFFIENGFMEDVNLYVANNRQQAVQMLFKGRVDLLMGGDIVLKNRLAQMGLSIQKLEKVFTLPKRRTGLSVALSKTTSKKLVAKFTHAFDVLSKEVEFNELFRR